jgi:hypothetical protein
MIVISESPAKNIREVCYINVDHDGKRYSATKHEAINPAKPIYKREFKKKGHL